VDDDKEMDAKCKCKMLAQANISKVLKTLLMWSIISNRQSLISHFIRGKHCQQGSNPSKSIKQPN
jgi:hypothetical protein